MAPLCTANAGVHIPISPRSGFWLVEGGFAGGHVVVVLYFISGVGLNDDNLRLLQTVTLVLAALGKPFCILADWNFEPATLVDSGWLGSVVGSVVAPGRPTCTMLGSATEIDFGVFSAQWIVKPTASLFEPWTPGPHTAVLFCLPCVQPVVNIEVMRKPRTFPIRRPFGPFRREVDPIDAGGDPLCTMPVGNDVLAAAAADIYNRIDLELSDKYGIPLLEFQW